MIGNVGSVSGLYGASLGPEQQAMQMFVKFMNDQGGINGHKIILHTADDGGDPARHTQLVKEFVEQKKVIAFVGNPTPVSLSSSSVQYQASRRIPDIGPDGGNDLNYGSPYMFPHTSAGKEETQAYYGAWAQAGKAEGLNKVGLIACQEVDICTQAFNDFDMVSRKVGLTPVYRTQSSIAKPDFTSECVGARNAGVQILTIFADVNTTRRIVTSCSRQNYRPKFSYPSGATNSEQAKDPAFNDVAYIASVTADWYSSRTPAQKEFQSAMARYLPGVDPVGNHMVGWVAGKLFQLAAGKIPAGATPTSAALADALYALKNDDLGGLTQPLTFTRGKNPPRVVCWFATKISGGSFRAVGDRQCL